MNNCPDIPSSEGSHTCVGIIPCTCKKIKLKKLQPPNIQHELNNAKGILREIGTHSGDNVFDHLSEIIKRILDERPPNVIDYFEEFSRSIREGKTKGSETVMKNLFDEPRCLRHAEAVMGLLNLIPEPYHKVEFEGEETIVEDDHLQKPTDTIMPVPENIIFLQLLWQLCGFGFRREEVFLLSCSMLKLRNNPATRSCRFWGKIFGTEKAYYILEVVLKPTEIEKRLHMMKKEMQNRLSEQLKEQKEKENRTLNPDLIPGLRWKNISKEDQEKMTIKQPSTPFPKVETKFDIPPESIGSGTNRYTYFVCNNLTEEWMELPIVTPRQIAVSRQIKKYLTGNLESEIISYPTFPGREKHFLRAMITRISSATYLAPINFFTTSSKTDNEGEEVEEENETEEEEDIHKLPKDNDVFLIMNSKYKPLSIEELCNLENWVHIRPVILKQGRIVWFDEKKALKTYLEGDGKTTQTKKKDEDDEEEEEEEEGEESIEEANTAREYGPRVLTPCSNDVSTEVAPIWSVRISAQYNTSARVVIVKSNLWPGAFTITADKICDNIYLGWGVKRVARNYSPPHIPPIQVEYPLEPNITEIFDPSAKDEEDWLLARKKTVPEKEQQSEQEEEEEEEEEKDQTDDEDSD